MRKINKNPIIALLFAIGLMLPLGTVSNGSESNRLTQSENLLCEEYCGEELIEEVKTVDMELLFDTIVIFVKKKEGFRSEIYRDVNGSKTIGYGHQLRPGENYTKITKKQADKILKKDLRDRSRMVKKYYKLTGPKNYAITMFVFNAGSGNFEKSRLKRLIDSNKPIDKEIVKWCHYTSKGKKIRNKGLLERRKFELEVYKM